AVSGVEPRAVGQQCRPPAKEHEEAERRDRHRHEKHSRQLSADPPSAARAQTPHLPVIHRPNQPSRFAPGTVLVLFIAGFCTATTYASWSPASSTSQKTRSNVPSS